MFKSTMLFLLLQIFSLHASPFELKFLPKKDVTYEDYVDIQNQLRSINIQPLMEELYIPDAGYTTLDDFYGRCSKGLSQQLIDPSGNLFPSTILEKIGKGGDSCFVTCVPFNGKYPDLALSIARELEKVGFDGYFLYRIGGFPNPTGNEIQYAGVPYSFKIFMMVEAYHKGFSKVIWIDSAVLPLKNPSMLFSWLDSTGTLLRGWPAKDYWRYIFPKTHSLLRDITGIDVLKTTYINTIVFGLKMDTVLARNLIADYTSLVEMGYPFLSCFPEEFVLTALLNRPESRHWQLAPFHVLTGPCTDLAREQYIISECRRNGYYFYHRIH